MEQLGYIALVGEVEVRSDNVTFAQFPLSPMAFLLDELRVVADRPEDDVEDGGSSTEIVPDESDSARNALELLTARVPSLTVRADVAGSASRSEIRIRGNASVFAEQHALHLRRRSESRRPIPGGSLRHRGSEDSRS